MIASPSSTSHAAADDRRAWVAPRLTRHESMTVLTQSVLGPHIGVPFMLQFGCSIGGGCGGSGPNGATRAFSSPNGA